eukprot:6192194-Pleurochrysis_carterae.AAC.1
MAFGREYARTVCVHGPAAHVEQRRRAAANGRVQRRRVHVHRGVRRSTHVGVACSPARGARRRRRAQGEHDRQRMAHAELLAPKRCVRRESPNV